MATCMTTVTDPWTEFQHWQLRIIVTAIVIRSLAYC